MADFTKFRTSVGGFHRGDVSDYIEALCAEHKRTEKQQQEELEALSDRLQELEKANALQLSEMQATQARAAELEEALNSTQSALDEALTMVEEQEALRAAEAAQIKEPSEDYAALELEAYRRAEATERLAQERAGRLRQNLNELLDNVTARYEQTSQEVEALTEDIRTNTRRLLDALSELELIFDETTGQLDIMDAGDPGDEEPAGEAE